MSNNIKELLKGKGLLAELEGCRNEEEAIKVLKRENLWGIINYPELEELKESYKNGEIEADGTLSLSQLDRVAGGAKVRENVKEARNKHLSRFTLLYERINEEENIGEVLQAELEIEDKLNDEEIAYLLNEVENAKANLDKIESDADKVGEPKETEKEEAPVKSEEEVPEEPAKEKNPVNEEAKEEPHVEEETHEEPVEQDPTEKVEEKEALAAELVKENVGEEHPVNEQEQKKEEVSVKGKNPTEEPLHDEKTEEAPNPEEFAGKSEDKGKDIVEEAVTVKIVEREEDISEEVQGSKTFKNTIEEKIKEGKEVKLELTSLGEALISKIKFEEAKEKCDKPMKETPQTPFPFEMKNTEDDGDIPYDIFEDIVAHRGKNTEPFLNELRDVWQNKEELREEIQRRIEKIGELRSKGNFTVAEKETDELRRLVLENSIVESEATADEEVFSSVIMPFAVESPSLSEDDAVKTLKRFQPNANWGPWVKYIYNIDNPYVNSILKLFIYTLKDTERNNPCTTRAINMFIRTLNSYKEDKKIIDASIPKSIEFNLFNTGMKECGIELANRQIIVDKKSTRFRESFKNMIKQSVALFPEKSQKILIEEIIPNYKFELISRNSTKLSTMQGGLNSKFEKNIIIREDLPVAGLAHELAHSIFDYFLDKDSGALEKVEDFLFLIASEAGQIKKEAFRLLVGLPSYLAAPVLAGLFDLMCKIEGKDSCKEIFDVSIEELNCINISGTVKSVEMYRGDLAQEGFAYMAQAHFEANMSEEGKLRYMLYQTIFPEAMKFVRNMLATPYMRP